MTGLWRGKGFEGDMSSQSDTNATYLDRAECAKYDFKRFLLYFTHFLSVKTM